MTEKLYPTHMLLSKNLRIKQRISEFAPGMMILLLVSIFSESISSYIPGVGSVSVAIVIAMFFGQALPSQLIKNKGIHFAEKHLLSLAIILMGFNFKFSTLITIGLSSMAIISIVTILTMILSLALGKVMNQHSKLSLLIGIGNAICGSSAIAATSPLVNKDKSDIGIAIATTNLVGIFGIFLLTYMLKSETTSPYYASMLIGGSLQAVGHVAAAGYGLNNDIGDMSIALKLARVVLLIPTLIFLSARMNRKVKSANRKFSRFKSLPMYLYLFMICSIIVNFYEVPQNYLDGIKWLSETCLILAMAAIGIKISLVKLVKKAPKSLLLSLFVFFGQILLLHSLMKIMI